MCDNEPLKIRPFVFSPSERLPTSRSGLVAKDTYADALRLQALKDSDARLALLYARHVKPTVKPVSFIVIYEIEKKEEYS